MSGFVCFVFWFILSPRPQMKYNKTKGSDCKKVKAESHKISTIHAASILPQRQTTNIKSKQRITKTNM